MIKKFLNRLTNYILRQRTLNRSQMLNSLAEEQIWYFGDEEVIQFPTPLSIDQEIPRQIKPYIYSHALNRPFVCEINNAELIGCKAVGITQEGLGLLETTVGRIDILKQSQLFQILKKKIIPVDGTLNTVCSLINACNHNYFHWITECLTQIEGMEFYYQQTGIKPLLLINKNHSPWQIESLNLMGYDSSTYIQWDMSRALVKRLIVPSVRRYQEKPPHDYISPASIKWLQQRILSHIIDSHDQNMYAKRIFISRRQASFRKILNEDEVIESLSLMGFTAYILESMSFSEQVKLFFGAEIVVGPHGAGLTNVIFSRQAAVLELFGSPDYIRPEYFQIASSLGLRYGFMICEFENKDLKVNIPKLCESIENLSS